MQKPSETIVLRALIVVAIGKPCATLTFLKGRDLILISCLYTVFILDEESGESMELSRGSGIQISTGLL